MKIGSLLNLNTNFTIRNSNKNIQSQPSSNINFGAYKLIGKFKDPNYTWVDNFVYELSNKMKVVIVPKKGPGSLSVNTVVKTGAMNESDDVRGISHFLEHLIFMGSKAKNGMKGLKKGEFIKLAESNGAEINAHTGTDRTAFFFKMNGANAQKFPELLGIHATKVKYPALSKKAFIQEKNTVIQEIKQSQDNPMVAVYYSLIKDLLGIDSNSGQLVLGTEENINKITRKDVFNYHHNSYSPDNIETYIVGDVNPKKVIKLVDKYFDTPDFRPTEKPLFQEKINPAQNVKISYMTSPKIQAPIMYVGFAGPKNIEAKETVAVNALLNIISKGMHSRFNVKLSELNSESISFVQKIGSNPSNTQAMLFGFSVKSGEEQIALNYFKDTISGLSSLPITQDELKIAKMSMLDDFNTAAEKASGITDLLENFNTGGGIDAYKNYVNDINSLTLTDLNNAAVKYFDPKKTAISILQPEGAQNKKVSFTGKVVISPKNLKKYVLPNNIRLFINDNSYKLRTAAILKVESNANRKLGVMEVLGKILESSTAIHSEEEFSLLKAREGVTNIGFESTNNGLTIKSHSIKEALPGALKIMKEMFFEPNINEATFKKAKDEFELILQRVPANADDGALEAMYGNHPEGETARRFKNELNNITLLDVQKCYEDLFKNGSASVTITGPVSKLEGLKDSVIKEISDISHVFSKEKIKEKPFILPENDLVVAQSEKGRVQSQIVRLFHIDEHELKDIAAMDVLDAILGSGGLSARMFKDLREKQGLAYNVSSSLKNSGTFGQQKLSIKTAILDNQGNINDNMEKSLIGFEKHLQNFITTPPTKNEVEAAKPGLITAYLDAFETAIEENGRLVKSLGSGHGATFYNKIIKEIEKVTSQDVQDAAKKFLTKPSVTSVLTTEEALSKSRGYLESLGKFKIYKTEDL